MSTRSKLMLWVDVRRKALAFSTVWSKMTETTTEDDDLMLRLAQAEDALQLAVIAYAKAVLLKEKK